MSDVYRSVDDYAIVTDLKYPTFREMLDLYPTIAAVYNQQTGGKLTREYQYNVLTGCKRFLQNVKLPDTIEYRSVNSKMVEEHYRICEMVGLSKFTANTYIYALKGLGARWTHIPYEQHGFKVESLKLPPMINPVYRYTQKSDEFKKKVKDAYRALETEDPGAWFFMTMMLNFGMRNSDVKRLEWSNFIETPRGVFLKYTPHKTHLTSGRIVHWPIPEDIWCKILRYKATHPDRPLCNTLVRKALNRTPEFETPDNVTRTEQTVRALMRSLGATGSKSAYELRKLCCDTIYSNFGQEAASAITGDNIDTVTKYYADPSGVSKKVDVTKLF